MIITDEFVMLNFPKTGSSFARKMIKKLYAEAGLPLEELLLPNIRNLQARGKVDHHGSFCQIPLEHKSKPVISIIRNPLDRFLSTYMYKAWADSPPLPLSEIIDKYPDFPNLSIDEFIRLQDESVSCRLGYDVKKAEIGMQSIQIVQMFFKNPEATLKNIFTGNYLKDELLSEIGKIKFLNQENLRNDLFDFLVDLGFKKEEADFIFNEKASNVTNYDIDDKSLLITDNARSYITDKEWLYNMIWKNIENI